MGLEDVLFKLPGFLAFQMSLAHHFQIDENGLICLFPTFLPTFPLPNNFLSTFPLPSFPFPTFPLSSFLCPIFLSTRTELLISTFFSTVPLPFPLLFFFLLFLIYFSYSYFSLIFPFYKFSTIYSLLSTLTSSDCPFCLTQSNFSSQRGK